MKTWENDPTDTADWRLSLAFAIVTLALVVVVGVVVFG